MTWLAPLFLAAGAAAALAVVALHFFARRRPREVPLPTARFLPERASEAASRAARPSDLALLVLRVLAVLLAAAAFARPVLRGARQPVARLLLVDVSRDTRSASEVRDSARSLMRAGDLAIAFDSSARLLAPGALDSLGSAGSAATGSLSAALIAARRNVAVLRDAADSIELVIVSPVAAGELDAATARIRAMWSGRARLVRVSGASGGGPARRVDVRGAPDDPLRATIALMGGAASSDARIIRSAVGGASDSAWAREAGHLLIVWPAAIVATDTIGAVAAGDAVVVAPFPHASPTGAGVAIARWADGSPAATESPAGGGCVRSVAVAIPSQGDLALREGMRRFAQAMLAPCGGATTTVPASDSIVAALKGAGPLLATDALAAESRSAIEPWLFGAVLLVLLTELALRARRAP